MVRLALVLSVAAAALSGFLAYDRFGRCSSCDAKAAPEPAAPAADERLLALEGRLLALERRPELAAAPTSPAGTDSAGGPTLAAGKRPAGSASAAPAALEEMEKRLAALEEYKTKAEDEAKRAPQFARALGGMRYPGGGPVYTSVDEAKEDLSLTDQQKGDFDRIVADAKRELDDLRKTPDDEGKTWDQVTSDLLATGPDGAMKLDIGKVLSFRTKTIPGRNETFGGAERRIQAGARTRLRSTLSTDQQSKFDRATVEPMLGTMGLGANVITSFKTRVDGWKPDR